MAIFRIMRPNPGIPVRLPFCLEDIQRLSVGDSLLLSGTVFTARDAVHQFLAAGNEPPCDLRGAVLYHCGPVMVRDGKSWRVIAAGPTTSIREEHYMAAIIARFGIRGIIGKGGMGTRTLEACREGGCLYLHAVGGAAQLLAARIRAVKGVYLLEKFGAPEAIWQLEVSDFPVVVTMDAHGNNLHASVFRDSESRLKKLLAAS